MAERNFRQDHMQRASSNQSESSGENDGHSFGHAHEQAPKAVENLAREAIKRLANRTASQRDVEAEVSSDPILHDFIAAVLRGNNAACMSIVERLREEGRSYLYIAEVLFSEAARDLGRRWENDELSFVDVSVGTAQLFAINSATRKLFKRTGLGSNPQVLFATLPTQSHTFGAIIAAEAFRQRDYEVELLIGSDPEAILSEVRDYNVRLVGFTAGRQDRLAEILSLAKRLKDLAEPPAIMLGGSAASTWHFALKEGTVDCIAQNVDKALIFAEDIIAGAP